MTAAERTERADMVEGMIPTAARIVCIVHGDGGQQDVAHVVAQLEPIEINALLVLLGAMVDPDRLIADAFAWVTWDEHGQPVAPSRTTRTIRQVAAVRWTNSGVEEALRDEQRRQARVLHLQYGYEPREIARHIGVHERTVARWKKAGWRGVA